MMWCLSASAFGAHCGRADRQVLGPMDMKRLVLLN